MPSVFIGERDLTTEGPLALPGPLAFSVQSYGHAAIGGPIRATITVSGEPAALWQLHGTLRCPVIIYNDRPKPVWWGYVETARVPAGPATIEYSLADMFTRVRLDYQVPYGDDHGLVTNTGWVSDATNLAKYGQKEIILNQGKFPTATATQAVTAELARLKDPVLSVERGVGQAQLLCRGWWDTLAWRLYDVDSLAVASYNFTSGEDVEDLAGGNEEIAESFTVATAQTVRILGFYLRQYERPGPLGGIGDADIQAKLYSGATSPTTLLASSATISDHFVQEQFHWHYFLLTSSVALSAGTTYWAAIQVSGARKNPFESKVDMAAGYAGGSAKDKSTRYGWRAKTYDIPFLVLRESDSETTIANICTAMGAFFAGTDVEGTSGIVFDEDRPADENVMADIETIVKAGTINSRRVLPDVRSNRIVRIREEPAAGSADYLWNADGTLLDNLGNPVDLSECPVGMWVKLADPVAQHPADGGVVRMFVEEAEYDPNRGVWRPRPRTAPDPMDFSALATLGYPRD